MEDAEVVATLALALVPGVGPQRLRLIIATFGSARAALAAPQSRLATLEGIGRAAAARRSPTRPSRRWRWSAGFQSSSPIASNRRRLRQRCEDGSPTSGS